MYVLIYVFIVIVCGECFLYIFNFILEEKKGSFPFLMGFFFFFPP